jgi:hypothetical protein
VKVARPVWSGGKPARAYLVHVAEIDDEEVGTPGLRERG